MIVIITLDNNFQTLYNSAALFLFHFYSLVSTNQRQLRHENTTHLHMKKSEREMKQLAFTVLLW